LRLRTLALATLKWLVRRWRRLQHPSQHVVFGDVAGSVVVHSAYLKIDRAKEHITDTAEVIMKTPPFTYVLQVNAVTGQRSIGPKKDEAVIERVAILAGDAIHNLRTALDQVVWSIFSPEAANDDERRKIAFPFRASAERFDAAVTEGIMSRASPEVIGVLKHYKPYPSGNKLLYSLHDLDITDKHRLLLPTGDYTFVHTDLLKAQIPDFPRNLGGTFGASQNRGPDIVYFGPRLGNRHQRRASAIDRVVEQKLNVPVHIVFAGLVTGDTQPVVPTLHRLVDLTKEVVGKLLEAWGGKI
jgi:hypothetical protein